MGALETHVQHSSIKSVALELLAEFFSLEVPEIFPINYDLTDCVVGDSNVVRADMSKSRFHQGPVSSFVCEAGQRGRIRLIFNMPIAGEPLPLPMV